MIYDKIANLPNYSFHNPRFASCVRDIVSNLEGEAAATGDFAKKKLVFETAAKEEKRFEAHKRNIDIHIVLEGHEYVEVTHADNLINATEYDSEHDYVLGDAAAASTFSGYLQPGYFLICFPDDAHKVGTHETGGRQVVKLVYKIAV